MARMLEDRSRSRDNNFDLLRLAAATMVLVSHAFPLSGAHEPFFGLPGHSLGAFGVEIFFAISGFLVARSWWRDPRLRAFAAKRALRILPGLMVAALLTAFVIGPLFTDLSLGAYLTTPETYGFVARNWTLFTINELLPGVFADNVFPLAVNGSLWTLPLEVFAYGVLAALGIAGVLRRRAMLLVLLAGLFVVTSPYSGIDLNVSSVPGGVDGGKIDLGLHLLAIFLTSTALFLYRERVPLHPALLAVAVGAIALNGWLPDAGATLTTLAIPYAVLFLACARRTRLNVLTRPGDVSYGIYVYAFPVTQSVVAVMGGSGPVAAVVLVSFVLTYGAAYASWRLVEAPALRLRARRAPAPVPAQAQAQATA